MRFSNPIPDFISNKQRKWYVHYTCETVNVSSKSTLFYGVGVIVLVAAVGFMAFKFGQKKGTESNQSNSSGAYGALGANNANTMYGGNTAYGANNTNTAYGGNPTYANPSYGNPFGQTA